MMQPGEADDKIRRTEERAENYEKLKRLTSEHTGLCRARNKIQIEIDAVVKQIVAISPFSRHQFEQSCSGCRNCNEPLCNECQSVCHRCGETDPFDTQDYGSDI